MAEEEPGVEQIEEDLEGDQDESARKTAQAALHFTIAKIAENEQKPEMKVSRLAIAALTELVMGYTENLAHDLENFAAHGNRRTVNTEDVKLVARRNPAVLAAVEKVAKEIAAESELKKEKKKRKADGAGKGSTKGSKKQHQQPADEIELAEPDEQ